MPRARRGYISTRLEKVKQIHSGGNIESAVAPDIHGSDELPILPVGRLEAGAPSLWITPVCFLNYKRFALRCDSEYTVMHEAAFSGNEG